jgi:hypothetical protein
MRNDHGGPANAEVHRKLTGIYEADGLAEALITLLRSNEEIDLHSRAAIADALEADLRKDKEAIRLRLVKPAHRSRAKVNTIEQMADMQEAAKLYALYREQGLTWDQASFLMEEHGFARTKLSEAIEYGDKRNVTIRYVPNKPPTLSE